MIREYDIVEPTTIDSFKKRLAAALTSNGNLKLTGILMPDELAKRRTTAPKPMAFRLRLIEFRYVDPSNANFLVVEAQDVINNHTVFISTEPKLQMSIVS